MHPSPTTSTEPTPLALRFSGCIAQAATGCLRIRHGQVKRTFYFIDGALTYAESNLLSETLGHHLRRCGALSPLEHKRARALQMRSGIRQGEALLKLGVLTPSQLYHYLRSHIREKVINAFTLTRGSLHFEADAETPRTKPRFAFNVFELLVDGLLARLSIDDADQRWRALEARRVRLEPLDDERWESARRVLPAPPPRQLPQTAGELFDAHLPPERREAMLIALQLLGLLTLEQSSEEPCRATLIPLATLSPPELLADADPQAEAIIQGYLRVTDADPWTVLGLTPGASEDTIQDAYARLKARFSPDRYADLSDAYRDKLVSLHHHLDDALQALLEAPDDVAPVSASRPRCQRIALLKAESIYLSGLAELEAGDTAVALDKFKQAQRLNPAEPLFLLYEGWTRTRLASCDTEREEGTRLILAAMGLNPLLPESYHFLAILAHEQGRDEAALEALTRCVELDPAHAGAMRMLNTLRGVPPQGERW